jgi:hypothetical protein
MRSDEAGMGRWRFGKTTLERSLECNKYKYGNSKLYKNYYK